MDIAIDTGRRADAVTPRIAANVRALRARLGLSLEGLSAACGVSRSALSLIERGESSPTAVVLDRVAAGLGVPLAALFGDEDAAVGDPPSPLSRHHDQVVWRDPASGYVRRTVSPPGLGVPAEIAEIELPPGARIAFENGVRGHVVHQQVWLLEGTADVTFGDETHRLGPGDCLAFELDRPTTFHNPTRRPARYAVVVSVGASRRTT